ncbi:unnamed protein product [Brugia timori]|uniref:DRMBL domain-containing protein n=1 Tax=Brugia timori TaxID=42155 RepID=A0A0R3Q546_9BILA|nr:unnamed protein product [Brugia timori]
MASLSMESLDEYVYTEDIPLKTWIKIDKICKIVRSPHTVSHGPYMFYVCLLFRLKGVKHRYILWESAIEYEHIKLWTPLKCHGWVDGEPRVNILEDGRESVIPRPNEAVVIGPHTGFGKLAYFSLDRRAPEVFHYRSAYEAAIAKELRDKKKKNN